MKPLVLTLGTKNQGKVAELTQWLQQLDDAQAASIQLTCNSEAADVEETGHDFLSNALLKAKGTVPVHGSTYVLAEDSGLVVDALDGRYDISPFPGIYSNRWLTNELRQILIGKSLPNERPLDRMTENGVSNTDLIYSLLSLMKGVKRRSARYCCGMVLLDTTDNTVFQVLESSELWVTEGLPRGENGFGYDPITHPVHENGDVSIKTTAELSATEKNQISHRGKAFKKVLRHCMLLRNNHE